MKAGVKKYLGTLMEWVTVCFDGLPHGLIVKLIENSYQCALCSEPFRCYGYNKLQKHFKERHPAETDIQYFKEFDWIVLKAGDGHVEMNVMKAFF